MKKLLVILLGFCFALPAFAAGVRAVNNEAWLDHLAQMQVIRQQMLSLITRENPTADDKAVLESLNQEFAAKKAEWENYLVTVSEVQESAKADEEKVEPAVEQKSDACKVACQDKEQKKACAKGKDCCQVTGKECTDQNCGSDKKACKRGKKNWAQHVCGEACKNGCTKKKMENCCGSAMCKEAGQCIRNTKKAHNCKGCAKKANCGKAAKKACCDMASKACDKGQDCCPATDKNTCKPAKKRWGRHVCGEACKNGCIKPKMDNCCGSAMCKEAGKCIRETEKAAKACPKGDKCHKVTGIKCDKPCKDCLESNKD